MIPKILLGTPISMEKAYILPEWLEYVKSLTYPNLHILLVDNSVDPEWHKRIIKQGFHVIHLPPKGRPEKFIADSQELIRQYAVKGNFDYLFSLECDNFSEHNIIELLLTQRLDNINVPYFLKQGADTCVGVQIPVIKQPSYLVYDVIPAHMSIHYLDGQLHTGIPSIGCSLYSRRMFEGQRFRVEANQLGKYSDSFWHYDSITRGITPWVDTALFSTHKRNRKYGHLATKD
jgi:hypothetical protein